MFRHFPRLALPSVVTLVLVWAALSTSCYGTGGRGIGVPDSYAATPRADFTRLYRLNGRLRPDDMDSAEPHQPDKSCPPGSEYRGVFCLNSRGTGRQYYVSCKPIFKPRKNHYKVQPGEPSRKKYIRLSSACPGDHLCFPHPRGDERWEQSYNRRGRFVPQREGRFGLPQIDCIDRKLVSYWRWKARSEILEAEDALAATRCPQPAPTGPPTSKVPPASAAELPVSQAESSWRPAEEPPILEPDYLEGPSVPDIDQRGDPTMMDIGQSEDLTIPDVDEVYKWLYGELPPQSPCD